MAIAVTITSVDATRPGVISVTGKLTASGSYSTGGDTVDFTKATQDPAFSGILSSLISSQPPSAFTIWSQGGNFTRAYEAKIGTAQTNCLVLFGGSTYASQLAAGAYPADVTGDNIGFYAEFPKFS